MHADHGRVGTISGILGVGLVSLGGAWVLRNRSRVWARLRAFASEPDHAVNLAMTRIAFFAMTLYVLPWRDAHKWATLPEGLMIAPSGTQWMVDLGVLSSEVVRVLMVVLVVSAVTGIVGFFSRTSAWAFTTVAFYVMWIPQSFGKVDHSHHVLWFGLLLAIFPSGDALSIDSWRKGSPKREPSRSYGVPLRAMWLLFGVMYFFPGFFKFVSGGLAWAFSDNLVFQAQITWLSMDQLPLVRLDQLPTPLVWAAGLGTLLFEMGFIFCMFSKRFRPWAALIGFVFHEATALFLLIGFDSLQLLYVCFLPWHEFLPAIRQRLPNALSKRSALVPKEFSSRARQPVSEISAWSLVISTILVGFTANMDAWPVSTYPIFPAVDSPNAKSVEVVVTDLEGVQRNVIDDTDVLTWMPEYKMYRFLLANIEDPSRSEALSDLIACELGEPFSELAIYSNVVSSNVGEWERPISRELTHSLETGFERGAVPESLAFQDCG